LLRPLRQFLRLDRERQRLFLEAWWALASVRLALRFTPFKQLVVELTLHRDPVDPPGLGPEALAAVQRIGWAVRAAARFTPWQSTCLVQVLTAQRMLHKRLLPGVFYIGAAPGEAGGVGLHAHAWLKCGGQFVTGEAGHERYAVVSTFGWP
jgi:hypothetical protein